MAQRASIQALGDSLNQAIAAIAANIRRGEFRDKLTQASQPPMGAGQLLDPNAMAMASLQQREIPAGPRQPAPFAQMNVSPQAGREVMVGQAPSPFDALTAVLRSDPSMYGDPSMQQALRTELALSPKIEQRNPFMDTVREFPEGRQEMLTPAQQKAVKPEYRSITSSTGGPTYVIQDGIISEKRQRFENGVPVENEFDYKKVADASARDIAKSQLELAKQRIALAQRQGDETAYRFWQQQADEWDKYVMGLGQQATATGVSTLTPDQQAVIISKLEADIAAGKIKADYAREIANSLNIPFQKDAKPKEKINY